jgi:hypothetical protein
MAFLTLIVSPSGVERCCVSAPHNSDADTASKGATSTDWGMGAFLSSPVFLCYERLAIDSARSFSASVSVGTVGVSKPLDFLLMMDSFRRISRMFSSDWICTFVNKQEIELNLSPVLNIIDQFLNQLTSSLWLSILAPILRHELQQNDGATNPKNEFKDNDVFVIKLLQLLSWREIVGAQLEYMLRSTSSSSSEPDCNYEAAVPVFPILTSIISANMGEFCSSIILELYCNELVEFSRSVWPQLTLFSMGQNSENAALFILRSQMLNGISRMLLTVWSLIAKLFDRQLVKSSISVSFIEKLACITSKNSGLL